jgi:23S rRNA (uracil1939-C5)-methyltransferase
VPGELVRARVERADKRLAFAAVTGISSASPDRRAGFGDPACGGCVYSHISYARQLQLKSEIVGDAFARIGRAPLDEPVPVAASPECAYRMRARFHVDRGRAGFFREGTHALCDPLPTGQLSDAAIAAVRSAVEHVERGGARATSVELTENIAGTERALAVEVDDVAKVSRTALGRFVDGTAIGGCLVVDSRGSHAAVGELSVGDPIAVVSMGRASRGELRRQPESFFQANRFLVPSLVAAVIDAVLPEGDVVDLYAGVGLFSVALAAAGRTGITAVEGDRASGSDLQRNAGPFGEALTLLLESVEHSLASAQPVGDRATTIVVDPPRTGISADALASMIGLGAARVVYVSCDPATLARDARKLLDAGYSLSRIEAFDLFPNTPHVESVAVFDRRI